MKKLLIVATLSITVAAVIKRVAELEERVVFAEAEINTLSQLTKKDDVAILRSNNLNEKLRNYDSEFSFWISELANWDARKYS